MRPTLRRGLLLASAASTLLTTAPAQSQNDLTTPTGWAYLTSATPQEVTQQVNQGFRIVDLEVIETSPIRFAASFVHNAGDYAKGWAWYYDQTSLGVSLLLSQNNSRAIDIEPYETSAGIRYAVVMIANAGADFSPSQGWQTGFTGTDVNNWLANNPTRRIIDIQPYLDGGAQRYAFIWLSNTGTHASAWWIVVNGTSANVASVASTNSARIVDIERQGTDRFSAILTPSDGKATYYLYQVVGADLARLVDQFGCRITDIERNLTGLIPRYDVILRQNDNDLAIDTNIRMRDFLPLGATSGFLLRELGPTTSDVAGIFEARTFEPASLMKTAHHFTAMRRVALGLDALTNLVTEYSGLNGTCPTGTNLTLRPLQSVLQSMMESSSNTATEAIRSRYGTATIEATSAAYGATGIALNHTLGCLCGMPRNESRLIDFAALHNAVVNGALGAQRDTFYELMGNGLDFGMGSFDTSVTLAQELANSNLSTAAKQAFTAGIATAYKGGSYDCSTATSVEHHRSRGAYVRLPFRSGCNTDYREFFIGAWVNDALTIATAQDATGAGTENLFRHILRQAIASWETALCIPTASYCIAANNSTGTVGVCSATGTTYITQNDLVLRASNLPHFAFGYLLVSRSSGFSPGAGGGAGNLCLGGSIGRYSNFVSSSGFTGTLSRPFDVNAFPTPSGQPDSVQAGETLYFQWWHRDTSPTGTSTSNLTRGLRVTFI